VDRLAEKPFYQFLRQKVRAVLCSMSPRPLLEVGAGPGSVPRDWPQISANRRLLQTFRRRCPGADARGLKSVTANAEALSVRAECLRAPDLPAGILRAAECCPPRCCTHNCRMALPVGTIVWPIPTRSAARAQWLRSIRAADSRRRCRKAVYSLTHRTWRSWPMAGGG
jgi:hypothetical protein